MDLGKLIEWIKLPQKYLFAISLVTGVLLFSSPTFLDTLGLDQITKQYRPWIGVIFLVSLSLFLSHTIASLLPLVRDIFNTWLMKRRSRERLHNLTPPEKEILRDYFDQNTRTQYLSLTDGIVKELEVVGIIYRSSNFGNSAQQWPYNIQPWVRDYLRDHPQLLK